GWTTFTPPAAAPCRRFRGLVSHRRSQQVSAVYRVTAKQVAGELWSAIQITTAAGICATLDMIRDGSLPSRGFIRQENIPLASFLENRFGRYFANESTQKNPVSDNEMFAAA
ncbi:hypothetical protein NYR58_20005, partial [Chelativorans intermedius]|nr:hypothetical protein [Chelativorans intermedius]